MRVARFGLKMSSFGPPTPRFESSAEHLVQFCTENTCFFDFVDFPVLFTCMFVWEKCFKHVLECIWGACGEIWVKNVKFWPSNASFWELRRALGAVLHRKHVFFRFFHFPVLFTCMFVWEKCFKHVLECIWGACSEVWVKNVKFWPSNASFSVLCRALSAYSKLKNTFFVILSTLRCFLQACLYKSVSTKL